MKIKFSIDYRTHRGESVYVTGSAPELGGDDVRQALKLNLTTPSTWQLTIDTDGKSPFTYSYFVAHDTEGVTHREWGEPRLFIPGAGIVEHTLIDLWQNQPQDKPYYSSLFTQCINRRENREPQQLPTPGSLTINVQAPMVGSGEVLAICGSSVELGEWNPAKAIVMADTHYPTWSTTIPMSTAITGVEYKFVVLNRADRSLLCWEDGANRRLSLNPIDNKATATTVSGLRFCNPRPHWHGAGVAIPVFSVRSDDDFGVGDFYDLMKMVDWAEATGQKMLQILPINDTTMTHTWTDSYPYNANSTFALHPMYMRLSELGILADPARRHHYEALRAELNALAEVDYERVNEAKTAYMREIYAQEGRATLTSDDYKSFVDANAEWLIPYAAFCVLRDINSTPEFGRWGKYATYNPADIECFVNTHRPEIDFVCYVQYHLDRQMRRVHAYASAHGVAFKGDIPIGISRDSADAWINPRLFNMDCQAGAPPDDFSVVGQNWGFPTYNWEEMARDGFAWWKARFRKMADYFDAYRIDHVLGFFRIWQIPIDAVQGLLGIFNPALPFTPEEMRSSYDFWINPELQTAPFIRDYFLDDFFGPYTDEARSRFLLNLGDGCYALRSEFATQRLIADYFATQEPSEKNARFADGLMGLVADVLFIADPTEHGKYHPRIGAQNTCIYRSLNDYERDCFNRLYNDFFYRRHNDFWREKAMWKLPPLLNATSMLTCAEDLGMIPDCVPSVMNALQMLSLEIQRMPKDPQAEFGNTRAYPYLSVCTTSTHDMGGLRQWWEDDRQAAQHFFNHMLHEPGIAPYYAEPWICDRIITLNLQSPSMLAIFPLQDWLAISPELRRTDPRQELINIPAIPRHYWRYRMHLTVEELLDAADFNSAIRTKIRNAGR